QASIHYYFPTKSALVVEALKVYIRNFFQLLETTSSGFAISREKLKELFRLYQLNYDNPDEICLCTILVSNFQLLPKEVIGCLEAFNRELYQWVNCILKQGVDNKEFKSSVSCES